MYGYNSYKTNNIETASQLKLIVMMYAGAIKFANLAIINIEKKEIELANTNIIKAQNIVNELLASLNFDALEMAQELSNLYIYIHRLLIEGNIQKNVTPIKEAIDLLSNIKEGWEDLLNQENKNTNTKNNINISG